MPTTPPPSSDSASPSDRTPRPVTARAAWRPASSDPLDALSEVLREVAGEGVAVTFVFFTHTIPDPVVEACISQACDNGLIVSATTAGELGPDGFREGGISALSLAGGLRASARLLEHLDRLPLDRLDQLPDQLAADLDLALDQLDPARSVFVTLFDGLSNAEDMTTAYLGRLVRRVGLVGGSAGDGLEMRRTRVGLGTKVRSDAAVVLALTSETPLALISAHHFAPTGVWVTATRVDRSGRRVITLDHQPARARFAELAGCSLETLNATNTAHISFATQLRGRWMMCSVLDPSIDGPLNVARQVETGQRLMLMRAGDIVAATDAEVARLTQELGRTPRALLLFNCLGRHLSAAQDGQLQPLFDALHVAPLGGFNTYGEQFGTLHINHTLTGIAF